MTGRERERARQRSMPEPDPQPFGVYLHWPFCASKCPYCDFNSHVRFTPPDEPRFLRAFEAEISATRALTGPRATTSVFLGGGTPSLMAPATVAGVLAAIDRTWPLAPDCEITLEANPSSVEAARFQGYRAAGVNRVSLGVQALRDDALKALGRLHSVAAAKAAIAIARETFERISFDLIYARPGQTEAEWERELRDALAIAGTHLSLYQLTIEPETPFASLHARGRLVIPDDDQAERLYQVTDRMTTDAGLPAYEISNYARPGAECRHNLLYWRYGEYAGIGPGAHGRIVVDGQRLATLTEKSPEAWLARVEGSGDGLLLREVLTLTEQADEALLMGLRLTEGLDLDRLYVLAGVRPAPARIADLTEIGLVAPDSTPSRLVATPRGRLVLNPLVAEISKAFSSA